ncbi:sigma-70 family RNA polymerase sigma factor [Dactylosporangium aurantiacum]|uniref:Sigma-70 family RNA polymerase sigma factor n=1 Tax=Dactylosporangium aurantiacum TaxID=35754 RepID=A0A9Q9MFC4_9ACTN|nr:sigma-70 family RNA polymerase sigma factor [Dactylosporangium aurantiacum]MDG6105628.1 sigma-70 family RNA polymerase sigma factor [Dactylosporangium aurantiacum]UWZ57038.1 sigma-70 family RNA polymerase sigma factor [Dactylosporangium aurantiacum]
MDEPEFDTFFRTTMPMLLGYLIKSSWNLEQAKDAATEAMIDAYKQWDTIEHPKAWVYKVAARHLHRIRGRERDHDHADVVQTDPADPDGVAALDLGEEHRRVMAALRSLPPNQRKVFALHYDGWKHTEIADHLGMTEGTVRSHLRHARENLKRRLDADTATRDEE